MPANNKTQNAHTRTQTHTRTHVHTCTHAHTKIAHQNWITQSLGGAVAFNAIACVYIKSTLNACAFVSLQNERFSGDGGGGDGGDGDGKLYYILCICTQSFPAGGRPLPRRRRPLRLLLLLLPPSTMSSSSSQYAREHALRLIEIWKSEAGCVPSRVVFPSAHTHNNNNSSSSSSIVKVYRKKGHSHSRLYIFQ